MHIKIDFSWEDLTKVLLGIGCAFVALPRLLPASAPGPGRLVGGREDPNLPEIEPSNGWGLGHERDNAAANLIE